MTISSGGKTTEVLYGLGPVAEKTDEWNYVLSDGIKVPRQLTDDNGLTTLPVRYNPLCKPIETNGTGNFDASYISTLIDATSGLIYIGNGQYYDPETGRFLTRGVNPNSPNPYLPWNPITTFAGPLSLAFVYFSRRKGERTLRDRLVLFAFLMLIGANLACCDFGTPASPTTTPESNPTDTVTPDPTPTTVPSNTPAPTETPTQTVTPPPPCCASNEEYKQTILDKFGIIISNETGEWPSAHIQIAYSALSDIDDALRGSLKMMLVATKKFNHAWSEFYGGTAYPEEINFRASQANSQFPHQLIYHEMGHLLNYTQGNKFTNSLDTQAVYTDYPNQTGDWVMGRNGTDEPYIRDNFIGYKESSLYDPSGFVVDALMHPGGSLDFAPPHGDSAGEDWGDLFANYVAGNINLGEPEGRAKFEWTEYHLFGN